jgi:hypothetical protein
MRDMYLKTKTVNVGAIAIDSDALVWPLWRTPDKVKISAIRLGTNTTMTKADTNFNTFTIKNGTVSVAPWLTVRTALPVRPLLPEPWAALPW